MRWKLGLVCGVFMSGALAQNDASEAPAFSKAEVSRLAAMAPAERRAELKAMDPADRRGLWFAVMAETRGKSATATGNYRAATSGNTDTLDAGDAETNNGTPKMAVPQTGMIQYDSGPFTQSFGGGSLVGNRFDTVAGQSMQNGTVTAVQAVVVPGPSVSTTSAGFVILGPQTGGGGANALFSTFAIPNVGATETIDFLGISATFTNSFHVLFGDFSSGYVPAFGPGTTMGQGRHGVVGYTGGVGPNITSTFDFGGSLNSFVRASATILPVELLKNED
jgi:hypothetical protein